jgi:hypothetical protein
MLLQVKQVRGFWRLSDMFLPIVLLSVGQAHNLLWPFQISFLVWTTVVAIIMVLIPQRSDDVRLSHTVAIGICLLLQPFFGAQGLPFCICLAFWYGGNAVIQLRSHRAIGDRRRLKYAVVLVAILALLETGAYFVNYRGINLHSAPSGVSLLRGVSEFLAIGWGPVPDSPRFRFLQILSAFLVILCTALMIMKVITGDRQRAFGMLACISGALGLALGTAGGRCSLGPMMCAEPRYVTLGIPLLVACYMSLDLVQSWFARLVQLAMLLVAIALMPSNAEFGANVALWMEQRIHHFKDDIAAGRSVDEVAHRNVTKIFYDEREMRRLLHLMASYRVPGFERLQ